ncbi:MAG: hypothetical protein RL064_1256, partial [Bacteroidota bacterium]
MLALLDWLVIILTILYAGLLMAYRNWFDKLKPFTPIDVRRFTYFTVVIPARNEAANIKACIDSILSQDYPTAHFEVIVVDDFSEDDTAFIVKAISAQYP